MSGIVLLFNDMSLAVCQVLEDACKRHNAVDDISNAVALFATLGVVRCLPLNLSDHGLMDLCMGSASRANIVSKPSSTASSAIGSLLRQHKGQISVRSVEACFRAKSHQFRPALPVDLIQHPLQTTSSPNSTRFFWPGTCQ